jgi:hypothetical protein
MTDPTRAPRFLAIMLLAWLGAPAGAQAGQVIAPPGNSGVSQYVEVVPSAGGGVPVGSAGHKHPPVLSASTQHQLAASGKEGRSLAAFAQNTGVPRQGQVTKPSASGREKTMSKGRLRTQPKPPAPAGAQNASYAVSGSGGLGLGLPIALGLIALLAVAAAFMRHRRSAR